MRRFLGEAGVVATISHPAVVRMISVDVSEDGFLYQAQELVDGRPLDEREDDGPWPEAEVARLGSVLCDALAAAHERGIVHRDVKPSNVMLIGEEPGLKLLDFGLAKLFDDPNRNDEHRTGSRLVVGTPAYMAPEQVVAGDVTAKADVYAVGVVLFQLLTGKLAFEVEGASGIMMQHVSTDAPDVRTLRPEVRGEIASMIAACLSKQAAARPSARDLSTRLGGFADAHGAPSMQEIGDRNSRRPPPADPAGRTTASIARRMRGLASSLVFAALLPRI
jgi:serine/threonine-protein kinase